MKLTFLGTGTSHGVPMIGCSCAVCTSTDPRNYRRRSSIYVVTENKHLVFDTPPDFRDQVLSFGVGRVDSVFLTHPHADHIYGFDDVRRFSTMQQQHIPVYAQPRTIKQMRKKFDYVDRASYGFESVPRVQFTEMTETVSVGRARITPLPVSHGNDPVYGYLIEGDERRMAYIPDCNGIPETTFQLLKHLNVMILDGLRPKPHPTHFSISECIDHLHKIDAEKAYITHITHDSDHEQLQTQLGDAITVPWDGLEVEL
ncbi:MBL fold metallo-hydrolase [Verrucomicrobia bacterium S94]|nr:MBL fold metallo-hydrolase [Verrucomicrobia bacterium S94]